MFFLLRAAFWLSLVILLIPADPSDTPSSGAKPVSTFEAMGAAQSAYDDVKGFCGRNPAACEVGRSALDTFGAKARTGVRWVYEQLDGKDHTTTTGSTPKAEPRRAADQTGAPTTPRRPLS